jgi:hypothetical protein
MIFGIGRIGVDFRSADKFKACFTCKLDYKIFADITVSCKGILRFVSAAAMFFNA